MAFNSIYPIGRCPRPQPQPHVNVFAEERIQRFSHSCPPLFHNGCINTAFWSANGDRLFTGSDDKFVKVWDVNAIMESGNDHATAAQSLKTSHRSNIFCVKTPEKLNPNLVLTCAGDGRLLRNDLTSSKPVEHEKLLFEGSSFMHHFIIDIDQPSVIYSAGNEGIVGRIDLRESNKASVIFVNCQSRDSTLDCLPVKAVAQSSYLGSNYLFVGGDGYVVGTLDMRNILPMECPPDEIPSIHTLNGGGVANRASFIDRYSPTSTNSRVVYHAKTQQANLFASGFKDIFPSVAYKMSKNAKFNKAVTARDSLQSRVLDAALQDVQVSCISFSKDGSRMLVNYQNDNIYQFLLNGKKNVIDGNSIRSSNVYSGHKNRDTFLKTSSYFGQNDEYVVTGCDGGLLWVYDTASGSLEEGMVRECYSEFGGFLQSEVVAIFKADGRTCNGVIPHPHEPMLATYGIDSDAKIWTAASLSSLSSFKEEKEEERSCSDLSSPSLSSTKAATITSTATIPLAASSADNGSRDIARINKYLTFSGGRSHFWKSFMVPLVPELSLDSDESQLYHRPFTNSHLFGSKASPSAAVSTSPSNAMTCKYKACSVRDHSVGCFFFDCEYYQYGLSVRSIRVKKTPLSAWEYAAGGQFRSESSDPLLMAQSIQINQWRQYHKCHASRSHRLPISAVKAADNVHSADLDDPQLAIYGMLPYYPTAYITSLSKFNMAYVKFKLHEYFKGMFNAVSNKSSTDSNAINSKAIKNTSDLEAFLSGLYSYSLFDYNDANKYPQTLTTHGFDVVGGFFSTDMSCNLLGIDVDSTIKFIQFVSKWDKTVISPGSTSSSHVDNVVDGEGIGGGGGLHSFTRDSQKDSKMDIDEDEKFCSTQAIPVTANEIKTSLLGEQVQEEEQDDDVKEKQAPLTEVSFLFSSDDIKALESFYTQKMKRRRANPSIYVPNILNDYHIFIVTQLTSASLKLRKAGNQFLKLKKFENSFRCYQQSLNYCATALILGRSSDECSHVVWRNIKCFYTGVSTLGNTDDDDDHDDVEGKEGEEETFFGFQNYNVHYDVCDFFSQTERRTIIDSSGRSIPNTPVYHSFCDGFGQSTMMPRGTVFHCRTESIQIGNSLLDIRGYSPSTTTTTTTDAVLATAPDMISTGLTSSDASAIHASKVTAQNDKTSTAMPKPSSDDSILKPELPKVLRENDEKYVQVEEENKNRVLYLLSGPIIPLTADNDDNDDVKEEKEVARNCDGDIDDGNDGDEGCVPDLVSTSDSSDSESSSDDEKEGIEEIPLNIFALASSLKWMRYLESLQGYNSYSLPLILGNLAAVALQINDSKLVTVLCEKAIEVGISLRQPADSKIYYRLGQGYFNLKEYNLSVLAFSQALIIANSDSNVGDGSGGGGGSGGPPLATAPNSNSNSTTKNNTQIAAITKALNNAKMKFEEERKKISEKYKRMFESS